MRTEVEFSIGSLGAQGDGIARLNDGRQVFVPFVLPGERVRASVSVDRAGVLRGAVREILDPAPDRVAAPCPHFLICGGCALQHMANAAYRSWKIETLTTALGRRGIETPPLLPLVAAEPGTRRRADFTVRRRREDVLLGFNARASHRVVDLATCHVLDDRLTALIAPLRELFLGLLDPGESAEAVINLTDSGIDLLLVTAAALGANRRERLAVFAESHDIARISRRHPKKGGPEVILTRRPVQMVFGGIAVAIPPGAFLQATAAGEEALVAAVREGTLGAARSIADLYAGCGTLALPLARNAVVHAVDGSGPAIEAIDVAVRRAGVGSRLTTQVRDLDRRPLRPDELAQYDAVVFDPPRAGAKAQAAMLADSRVPRVVAISCNPATFARDARLLLDGGYALESVRPIDQFLWSPHLELAAVFRR